MNVIKPVTNDNGDILGYSFYCKGCREPHVYWTSGKLVWSFNGNLERPTFTPSLLNTWTNHEEGIRLVCHLFLTDGIVSYCGDCTHEMSGMSYQLEPPS